MLKIVSNQSKTYVFEKYRRFKDGSENLADDINIHTDHQKRLQKKETSKKFVIL